MDFVANFMENTTVKKYENRSTFVKRVKECVVAQFLLRHGVLVGVSSLPQRLCELTCVLIIYLFI